MTDCLYPYIPIPIPIHTHTHTDTHTHTHTEANVYWHRPWKLLNQAESDILNAALMASIVWLRMEAGVSLAHFDSTGFAQVGQQTVCPQSHMLSNLHFFKLIHNTNNSLDWINAKQETRQKCFAVVCCCCGAQPCCFVRFAMACGPHTSYRALEPAIENYGENVQVSMGTAVA